TPAEERVGDDVGIVHQLVVVVSRDVEENVDTAGAQFDDLSADLGDDAEHYLGDGRSTAPVLIVGGEDDRVTLVPRPERVRARSDRCPGELVAGGNPHDGCNLV